MAFDRELVTGKIRRWETFLEKYRLPDWEEIPDFGLYMEQVITLISQYLNYLPPMLREDQAVTAAAINNYVRTKIMPSPQKKKYYRVHIAYLIMICSLKQNLSIALISKIIPTGIDDEEIRRKYEAFVALQRISAKRFTDDIRSVIAPILSQNDSPDFSEDQISSLICYSAIFGSLSKLLAEKLILLDGLTLENGGSIETE